MLLKNFTRDELLEWMRDNGACSDSMYWVEYLHDPEDTVRDILADCHHFGWLHWAGKRLGLDVHEVAVSWLNEPVRDTRQECDEMNERYCALLRPLFIFEE